MQVEFKSIITCPKCEGQKEELMPEDACVYFYQCTHCNAVLKLDDEECCVFCTYGSVPCPPKQRQLHEDCKQA